MKYNDFIGANYKYFKIKRANDFDWGTIKTTDGLLSEQIRNAGGIEISLRDYVTMRLGKWFWEKHKKRFYKMQPSELGALVLNDDIEGENVNKYDYKELNQKLSNNRPA